MQRRELVNILKEEQRFQNDRRKQLELNKVIRLMRSDSMESLARFKALIFRKGLIYLEVFDEDQITELENIAYMLFHEREFHKSKLLRFVLSMNVASFNLAESAIDDVCNFFIRLDQLNNYEDLYYDGYVYIDELMEEDRLRG